MTAARIGDYAIIGDGRSAALVSRQGSIDWLCWPRFDSPSLFAAILDSERGGFWQVAARNTTHTSRSYVDDSNVLVTIFNTQNGRMRLTDFMPVCSEEDKTRALWPEHQILRLVECESGEVEL